MQVLHSPASELLQRAPKEPALYGKVGVLMGGYAEYDVSLSSGQEVLTAFQQAGLNAHPILAQPDNGWFKDLVNGDFDRVFIALHGKVGEDGTVQAALELAGIPYTGSGVCASVLAMHKLRTKQIWQTLGLPSLPYLEMKEGDDPAAIVKQLGLPLAVKASCSGSTLGVSKVTRIEDIPKAYALAREFDDTVIVEPWVMGTEYAVPVIDRYAMPSIRIEPKQEFYDYAAKYIDDATGFFCPSELSDEDESALRALAEQAYLSLGCKTLGRVDFIRDANGKFWALEVNTIPGLTTHSLMPRSVKALGFTFTDFVLCILATTL